uniref:NADH dehydrogenase subunit 6b n=1 Tax=Ishige okamurae TaxID=233772 RepID=A0A4Y5T7Y0_9PHAE|nr:NADH dehydrogenase subunit 6b [Ishige okamurae]
MLKTVDNNSSIEVLGCVLYTHQFTLLLLIGIILLVAMVGSICITLQEKTKKETINRQISRQPSLFIFSGNQIKENHHKPIT